MSAAANESLLKTLGFERCVRFGAQKPKPVEMNTISFLVQSFLISGADLSIRGWQ